MVVRLSQAEKLRLCEAMGGALKRLRAAAGATQEDLAELTGISVERISRIENGAYTMRWSQFNCFTLAFTMNAKAKELMIAAKLLTPRLLQALQRKDAQVPPELDVPVGEALAREFETDFRIASSLSSALDEEKR